MQVVEVKVSLAVVALLAASCSHPVSAPVQLLRLDDGLAALTSEFNVARDATRLVFLLSPT